MHRTCSGTDILLFSRTFKATVCVFEYTVYFFFFVAYSFSNESNGNFAVHTRESNGIGVLALLVDFN